MTEPEQKLTPATPDDLAESLSCALRFEGHESRHDSDRLNADTVATAGVDVKRPVAESHLTAMILAAERGTDTFVARKQGAQSIREFDVLVEDNDALLVAHDIVAVQTVAEFVEIIFALGALVAPGGKDGGADFVWLGRARLVDRG